MTSIETRRARIQQLKHDIRALQVRLLHEEKRLNQQLQSVVDEDEDEGFVRYENIRYHTKAGHEGEGKFWEIKMEGPIVTTRYGALGDTPRYTTKEFATRQAADKFVNTILRSKQRKGYVRV